MAIAANGVRGSPLHHKGEFTLLIGLYDPCIGKVPAAGQVAVDVEDDGGILWEGWVGGRLPHGIVFIFIGLLWGLYLPTLAFF